MAQKQHSIGSQVQSTCSEQASQAANATIMNTYTIGSVAHCYACIHNVFTNMSFECDPMMFQMFQHYQNYMVAPFMLLSEGEALFA